VRERNSQANNFFVNREGRWSREGAGQLKQRLGGKSDETSTPIGEGDRRIERELWAKTRGGGTGKNWNRQRKLTEKKKKVGRRHEWRKKKGDPEREHSRQNKTRSNSIRSGRGWVKTHTPDNGDLNKERQRSALASKGA